MRQNGTRFVMKSRTRSSISLLLPVRERPTPWMWLMNSHGSRTMFSATRTLGLKYLSPLHVVDSFQVLTRVVVHSFRERPFIVTPEVSELLCFLSDRASLFRLFVLEEREHLLFIVIVDEVHSDDLAHL